MSIYEYSHGGNAVFEKGKSSVIDFSANINPLGIPQSVKDAIVKEIAYSDRYPDNFSTELRQRIGLFENVKPDWIFCGNGASDIIFRLPRAVHAKRVMVTAPTFSDYERSARSFGAEVIYHRLFSDNSFTVDSSIVEEVQRQKPDLVYICNPNNPSGQLTEANVIKDLLDCCKQAGTWLAVDECFLDFTEQADRYTSKVFLEDYLNLVILKAFTKMFAIPGLRLGYALCANEKLIEGFYFHGADWPVSNLAQAAGIAALEDADRFIAQTVEYTSGERARIEHGLTELGFKVFKASANYVFFQNKLPFDLHRELDKFGIRIRSCGNYPGLDESYCRIGVSDRESNDRLLDVIGEIMKG